MNGGADLGGMQGFGPVVDEPEYPKFHQPWESRVMAIVVALGACRQWNIDQSRYARESLPPADYLRFSYYRIWLEGAQKLLLSTGMVTVEELAEGKLHRPAIQVANKMEAEKVWDMLHALGGAADRPAQGEPSFAIGDRVSTINTHPQSHTRLPRYARAKTGTISKVLGFHVFPDISAKGDRDDPQWLYQVCFSARELWGGDKNPRDKVTLDLWEPHLMAMTDD